MKKYMFDKNKINYELRKNNSNLPYYIIRDYRRNQTLNDEYLAQEKYLAKKLPITSNEFLILEEIHKKQPLSLEEKFQKLESSKMETFFDIHYYNRLKEDNPIYLIDHFLYHGIRFGNQLDVLESILQEQAILAGKYVKDCWWSDNDENCNEGEYVSLIDVDGEYSLGYKTFVLPNISFVISPYCNAVKTIYLSYDEYIELKKMYPKTNNRYSYEINEYQVKDKVDIDYIKAIGIPYQYFISYNIIGGQHG